MIAILHLKLLSAKGDGKEASAELSAYGRRLLMEFRIGTNNSMRDHRVGEIVELTFAGDEH